MIDVKALVKNAVKDDPEIMKNILEGAMCKVLTKQESDLDELIEAYKSGQLTKQEVEIEMEREKEIVEAELLTYQICSSSEIKKVMNNIFTQIEESL